ncbi:winged helix-turn-helix transcriptional regulator [Actinomadura sp. NAK00032]|nr:winged helix-turn-helix domain-containing protein [Actinomadura sp. NAK00032]QKW40870.1 winged helix-turn-helix transcriptional regulator [Actinomadura sp. NAK00032]
MTRGSPGSGSVTSTRNRPSITRTRTLTTPPLPRPCREPLYRQVAAEIERRIDEGVYQPGRCLPSSAALSDEFGVSRRTAVEALGVLREKGVVRGVVGRGTFVVDPAERPRTG